MPNIYNLFKFLEKKRGTKTPPELKLIYAPDELTDKDLDVKGPLDLRDTQITSLPDNLKVGDDLILSNTPIITLPNNLQVGFNLYLENTQITSLPDNLKVEGTLNLSNTKITSLPDNLKVGDFLILLKTPLAEKHTEEEIRKMKELLGGIKDDKEDK